MRIVWFYFVLIADCYFDALPGSNTPFCQVLLLFLICVINCAEHCVYVGCGSIFANLGGSDRVGSELCGNCVSTESIFLLAMLLSH